MAIKFENGAGAFIFFILAVVSFIMLGVNKKSQNALRKKYPTIDSIKKNKDGKVDGLPVGLTLAAYENYKNTWEGTWMWFGLSFIVVTILFLAIP
jgi:NADH:ubiquinone oxidoreductase subunit 3 (subunit A)